MERAADKSKRGVKSLNELSTPARDMVKSAINTMFIDDTPARDMVQSEVDEIYAQNKLLSPSVSRAASASASKKLAAKQGKLKKNEKKLKASDFTALIRPA